MSTTKQQNIDYLKYYNKKLLTLIDEVSFLIKNTKQPSIPEYLNHINLEKEINKLKYYNWSNDFILNGVQSANTGFVLQNPTLEEFTIKPWIQYFEYFRKHNQAKLLILGGGDLSKEVGLLHQYAQKNQIDTKKLRILATDINTESLHTNINRWNNLRISLMELNITNPTNLSTVISQYQPDVITLYSVIAALPEQDQKDIVLTLSKYMKPGSKIIFGISLPGSSLNLYGKSLKFKFDIVKKSCFDLTASTLFHQKEQFNRFPFLFKEEPRLLSPKAKADFPNLANINPASLFYITTHINRFINSGFTIESLSLEEVQNKVGDTRPASLPAYLTLYCSKKQ